MEKTVKEIIEETNYPQYISIFDKNFKYITGQEKYSKIKTNYILSCYGKEKVKIYNYSKDILIIQLQKGIKQ